MGHDDRRLLQREGVLFFGGVIAGLSHELSNVLNIINEMAGLQQDIVGGAQPESTDAADRLFELAGRIKAQVERGETYNRYLHRLAHSVDDADTVFDLGETLELVSSLAARPARLARIELVMQPPEQPVTLEGDPFALILTIYGLIGVVLSAADSERRVEVRAAAHGKAVRITITSADSLPADVIDETAAALRVGHAAWGVVHTLDRPPDAHHSVILDLPVVAPVPHATPDDDRQEGPHVT